MLESLFDTAPQDPADILRTVFGHPSFRGQQEDVVRHVTGGGDAVVLFPTGAGKSMCYQVPALARQGVGIVVSPLIALMRDQVEALQPGRGQRRDAQLLDQLRRVLQNLPRPQGRHARPALCRPRSAWCCPASSR